MAKQNTALAVRKPAPREMPGLRRARLLRKAVGPLGRPPRLTPEVESAILAALKVGAYLETAAAFAGIDPATLRRWLRKGAAAQYSTIYSRFCAQIKKAAAECDVKDLMTIEAAGKAGPQFWTAAAWRLERRSPQNWAIRGAGDARGPMISVTQEDGKGGRTTVVIDVGQEEPRRALPQAPPVMVEGQASSPVIDVKALDVTPKGGNGNGAGKKHGR